MVSRVEPKPGTNQEKVLKLLQYTFPSPTNILDIAIKLYGYDAPSDIQAAKQVVAQLRLKGYVIERRSVSTYQLCVKDPTLRTQNWNFGELSYALVSTLKLNPGIGTKELATRIYGYQDSTTNRRLRNLINHARRTHKIRTENRYTGGTYYYEGILHG